MNFMRSNSLIVRSLRFIVATFACALMFFSSAYPAAAMGSSTPSSPKVGEANLDKVQEKTDDSVTNPPMTLKEVTERSQEGLNEVQGGADAQKMSNPANSQQATSFVEEVTKTLENIGK